MIKIKILKKDTFESITVSGHACFDEFNKDIVCASVSSILITTVNGILRIDDSSISLEETNGVKITVLKYDLVVDKLLLNMVELFNDLAKKYPNNIKIIWGGVN